MDTPFHQDFYVRHNRARWSHLDSLGLLVPGMRVLEVGAGIGDHTEYLLSKGCSVVATEARIENLAILRGRFPGVPSLSLDLDDPPQLAEGGFDAVYCYGTLYHLSRPAAAISFMAGLGRMLLLETCVSYGNRSEVVFCPESACPTQSVHGIGCRPTRIWVMEELRRHFPFVFTTRTQPNHEEFPSDWTKQTHPGLNRAVFVASRTVMEDDRFLESLPDRQEVLMRNHA